MNHPLSVPIVLIIFNRPDTTIKVFQAIREVQPKTLFVIADGPRADYPDDYERCQATRAIIQTIDWDCQLLTNYSDINLGCGKRVSTGIDWVFDHADEAIILEDDCLPDLSFFIFCRELLQGFRHDDRVMMISGTNHLGDWKKELQSYHFSLYGGVWGWATWKRAWQHYNYEMKGWENPLVQEKVLEILVDQPQFEYRKKVAQKLFNQEINTWDYQWTWARCKRAGMSIVPSLNLVSNLGFSQSATHTISSSIHQFILDRGMMHFPLQQPQLNQIDRDYDRQYFLWMVGNPDNDMILQRVLRLLRKNRNIPALLLIEKLLNEGCPNCELVSLKAIALAQVGNMPRALEVLKVPLTKSLESVEADRLIDALKSDFGLA